jgi:hypothetical protein
MTVCHLSFLPWDVVVTSLPWARLLPRRSFSNCYILSLLRPARPERFPNQLTASPSYNRYPKFFYFLLNHSANTIILTVLLFFVFFFSFTINHPKFASVSVVDGRCSYIIGSPYSVCSIFFRFAGGLPLHKFHFLVFRNSIYTSFARFTIWRLNVFWRVL